MKTSEDIEQAILIGTIIKRRRKSLMMNLREFAAEAGVSTGEVWKWEEGVHLPRSHHQRKLVQILGVKSWDELIRE